MQAHARRTDHQTSMEAAASVKDLTKTQERIVHLLGRHGNMQRDDLIAHWREDYPEDLTTDQSIRSRLSELMDRDFVDEVGETRNFRGRRVQLVGLPTIPHLF